MIVLEHRMLIAYAYIQSQVLRKHAMSHAESILYLFKNLMDLDADL